MAEEMIAISSADVANDKGTTIEFVPAGSGIYAMPLDDFFAGATVIESTATESTATESAN